MLSKLRISAHKHAIEGGRFLNIPKHERIYTACNTGEVDDEEQMSSNFIEKYLNQRETTLS